MSIQLLKPIITEKTMRLAQAGQYTFKTNHYRFIQGSRD